MKIVFFTTDFPPTVGGISEFSRSIAYHMPESPRVERVQVVALKNEQSGVEELNKKFSIIRVRNRSFLSLLWSVLKFSFRFRTHDVFHATSLFPIGFLTVLIGKYIFRKPVFVTFYGTDILSNLGSKKTKRAKVWTLKHATKGIAFSYATRNSASERHGIPLERFAMVYYPLPDNPLEVSDEAVRALKERYGIKEDDFVILFAGHLVRRKGPEDLLKALSYIPDEHVKLIFVNDGPLRSQLERDVKRYTLNARVIFAGKVPDPFPFYKIAHVFSMPSFFDKEEGDVEGLGIVFLEAEQYGVPVLGTHSGGIPEAIVDQKSGFLVPERDTKALADKILLLKQNPALRTEMGEYGKKFVREKFDWRKSVNGHLDLYRSYMN